MKTVSTFIKKNEDKVPEEHVISLMDVALQSTSARWWENHRNSPSRWEDVTITLKTRFQVALGPQLEKKYRGDSDPQLHKFTCECKRKMEKYLKSLWVHNFIHSLDTIPQALYLTEEKKRQTDI